MLSSRRFFICTAMSLAVPALWAEKGAAQTQPPPYQPSGIMHYRGFSVTAAALGRVPNGQAIRAALERQIDICVEAGLSADNLAFIRSVPVTLRIGAMGGPGFYDGRRITLIPELYPPNNPVLLHEFLHAYHAHRLPGGKNNADILAFYNRAKSTPDMYPADSYMLSNVGEYFAMTASVFLHGQAARDPFTRAQLKAKQPIYYNWLEKEFGAR